MSGVQVEAGDGPIVNRHTTNSDAIAIVGDSMPYDSMLWASTGGSR